MVDVSLALSGVVGVLLSAGYVWWAVGRYATPQVPVTVFDERKVLAAYTVGLFVGVPLAAAYVLLTASFANAGLVGAALFLGGLVVGTEVAQRMLTRSAYWGATAAVPFYAVSFRAAVGGILALAAVADYLGGPSTPAVLGIATAMATAVALVALEVAGSFLSYRPRGGGAARPGGPVAGGLFGAVAFFLLGIGPSTGAAGALGAPLVVLLGSTLVYRGRRHLLAEVPPPTGGAKPLPSGSPSAYGRRPPASPPPADGPDRLQPLGPRAGPGDDRSTVPRIES